MALCVLHSAMSTKTAAVELLEDGVSICCIQDHFRQVFVFVFFVCFFYATAYVAQLPNWRFSGKVLDF